MQLREVPDVLNGRPRERDVLRAVVAESAAFLSSIAFRRRFSSTTVFSAAKDYLAKT